MHVGNRCTGATGKARVGSCNARFPCPVQALQELEQRFASEANPPDAETLKWYLRDRYFDVEEAEIKLRSTLRWRQSFQ
jgi:hypothetical protein